MHGAVQWLKASVGSWEGRFGMAIVLTGLTIALVIAAKWGTANRGPMARADETASRLGETLQTNSTAASPGVFSGHHGAKPLTGEPAQGERGASPTPLIPSLRNPLRPAETPPANERSDDDLPVRAASENPLGARSLAVGSVGQTATKTAFEQPSGATPRVLPPPPTEASSNAPTAGAVPGQAMIPSEAAVARSGAEDPTNPPMDRPEPSPSRAISDGDIPDASQVFPLAPGAEGDSSDGFGGRESKGPRPDISAGAPGPLGGHVALPEGAGQPVAPPGLVATEPLPGAIPPANPPGTMSDRSDSRSFAGPGRVLPETRATAPPSSPFDSLPPPMAGTSPAIISPPSTRAARPLPTGSSLPDGFGAASGISPISGEPSPISSAGAEGEARPGDPALEGPQTSQVTIQKILPREVQVGKPASSRIVVRNSGAIAIPKVEVQDPIPWGVRVLRTNPQASQQTQGLLVWTLGPLKPGDEIALEAEFMPLQEGELGSVATVLVHSQASARTTSTRPQLVLKVQMPSQTLIGDEVLMTMTVSNTGSGTATNVVLEEHVPPEMQHPAGSELENAIGDLRPGESRQVQLRLRAVRPGNATNRLIARADGNLRVEEQNTITILAPQINLAIEGPAKRFLDREATYQVVISNSGTASSRMVRLTAALPPGLQFVKTNNNGSYDPTTHSVQWLLEELPAGQTGRVELTVRPIAAGEQPITCTVRDELGLGGEQRLAIQVEGISALYFQVVDTKDPVEVGGNTVYEIRVVNQGTKEATNVQVMVTMPEGLRALAGEGPTANVINGSEVLFEKLPRLAARGEVIFRVRAQAVAAGDQRVRVQILSDDIRLPVTKEESTQVYADSP